MVPRRFAIHLHAVRQLLQRRPRLRLGVEGGDRPNSGLPQATRWLARLRASAPRGLQVQPDGKARGRLRLLEARRRRDDLLDPRRPPAAMSNLALLERQPSLRVGLGLCPREDLPRHEQRPTLRLHPNRDRPNAKDLVSARPGVGDPIGHRSVIQSGRPRRRAGNSCSDAPSCGSARAAAFMPHGNPDAPSESGRAWGLATLAPSENQGTGQPGSFDEASVLVLNTARDSPAGPRGMPRAPAVHGAGRL